MRRTSDILVVVGVLGTLATKLKKYVKEIGIDMIAEQVQKYGTAWLWLRI